MSMKLLRSSTGASLESGVPVPTITNLCNRGVLNPQRDSSGRRLFTDEDIEQLKTYRSHLDALKASRSGVYTTDAAPRGVSREELNRMGARKPKHSK